MVCGVTSLNQSDSIKEIDFVIMQSIKLPIELKFTLMILLAVALLTGCATTTTVQSRKQERMAAYQALTPDLRDAVDKGQLKYGLSKDAVYIAWGQPNQPSIGPLSSKIVAATLGSVTILRWSRFSVAISK